MLAPTPLLTAVDSTSHIHLIIGSNPLAAARCTRSLDSGATPKLLTPEADLHYGLQKRIDEGQVEWLKRGFQEEDLKTLGREEVDGVVDAVFVTMGGRDPLSTRISTLCRRLRVPINVADAPNLCTFTLLSTHSDGPLQIGITTSGKGCKLATRIRREIASSLPSNLGAACERLGTMRRRIWEEDHAAELALDLEAEVEDTGQQSTFNRLVKPEDRDGARDRRMRWLSQICEYWPLSRLAAITDEDVDTILKNYSASSLSEGPSTPGGGLTAARLDDRRRGRGRIILAGTGPGHPDLLTTATHKAITSASLILADKLVPAPVLSLVPRRVPVHIARKFPGNADNAQQELLELGLEGLHAGKTVVRLKQGDPYIYGRGAEEVDFFRKHGYEAIVLPGITSALSAPLFATIPSTHRAVADQVLLCTGTGRKGAAPDPPEYVPSRTAVFLMALHRLSALVDALTGESLPPVEDDKPTITVAARRPWPRDTPCAVIERASCPDQRVIRTTLGYVTAAVEESGSRPPGLLVVGWSCGVLYEGKQRWVVEEGFKGLDGIVGEEVGAGVVNGGLGVSDVAAG
ncbi:MAG: mRNA splicing protein prp18 [Chaenotheca gracillima]|nr:MAG: mRNA splicing protein prp18 [Chaenotheca gracillima]